MERAHPSAQGLIALCVPGEQRRNGGRDVVGAGGQYRGRRTDTALLAAVSPEPMLRRSVAAELRSSGTTSRYAMGAQ